jgi:VanZ family protein
LDDIRDHSGEKRKENYHHDRHCISRHLWAPLASREVESAPRRPFSFLWRAFCGVEGTSAGAGEYCGVARRSEILADEGDDRDVPWHIAQASGHRGVHDWHRSGRLGREQAAEMTRKLYLVTAWAALSAIVVLTVVPPNLRPTTDAPHDIEHAAAFLITGILFGLAYAGRERTVSIGAVLFCAMIELLQLYVPGRHARWIDFAVDALAAVFGIFVGALGSRAHQKRRP